MLPHPAMAISKRSINHNNKHQQLQRPRLGMSPKTARIQLARPTSVFSAKREAKGKGMAGAGAASPWTQGTGWDGTGVPAAGAGEALPLTRGGPQLPAAPSSSPSPFRHFCFIYEYVAGIQMSYLFCGRLTFPQRASACLTQGPAETAQEEKERAKECFSALFYSFPPPPRPPLFYFACVSGALFPGCPPLTPLLPFHPLGPALAPFMLHDSSNGSPGGSYRECIGSLGERKPPTSYTPDV